MNEVWGRCAEEVSLDLTGSFWTNLLPRVKNEATIKVFASQASEESDWETTAYGLSKRLVSRSKHRSPGLQSPGLFFRVLQLLQRVTKVLDSLHNIHSWGATV